MDRDKFILQQAQEFFDYFCDEVPPVYRDIGDLDATEDYEEVMAVLGSQVEREWYDLWQSIYENLDEFIGHFTQHNK